jgi:nucleoside-diphosphate-sugar epimerase
MKKKLLITGASGFIGSFMVEEALNRDYEVYAGIRSTSSTRYLKDDRIKFISLDYSHKPELRSKLLELKNEGISFHYIIHNAGITKARKKKEYFTVNYIYTKNLIKSLILTGTVPAKFIFISSLAAFGPGNDINNTIRETDQPNPVTTYGKSKLKTENYIHSLTGFPCIIIRPTAVYGPRDKDIFLYFRLINKNIEPYIGNKPQKISLIYVKDLVNAIFAAAESPFINRSYFVSDGNDYSMRDVSNTIKKHLEKKTLSFTIPAQLLRIIAFVLEKCCSLFGYMPALNLEKVNELESCNWKCDIEPLQSDLNFKPEYDLDKAVKETAEWYKKEGWL